MKIAKEFIVLQQDRKDCGIASLSSVVKFFGGEESFERIRELSGCDEKGTTLLGLYQASHDLGLQAEPYSIELDLLHTLHYPIILHVSPEKYWDHFIVFYGYQDGIYHFMDPAKGLVKLEKTELAKIWKSGSILTFKVSEGFKTVDDKNREKWNWIKQFLKEDRSKIQGSIFLGLIISSLGMFTAIFSQILIDEILDKRDVSLLIQALIFLAVLMIFKIALSYGRSLLLIRQGQNFNNNIVGFFYDRLIRLPKRFFDTRDTGDVIARLNDTTRIQRMVNLVINKVTIQLIIAVVSLLVIIFYSVEVGLLVVLIMPFYLFLLNRFHLPIQRKQRIVMQSNALAQGSFIETVQGIDEIKSFLKELFFINRIKYVYSDFQEKAVELGITGAKYVTNIQFLNAMAQILILSLSSYLVLDDNISIGQLVAILSIQGGFFSSLEVIINSNITLNESKIAMDRMHEFSDIRTDDEVPDQRTGLSKVELKSIGIREGAFRFPGRSLLFNRLNLNLTIGEKVVLLGNSGSGKSTILNLLQGFYKLNGGDLVLNGQKLRFSEDLKCQIACVNQDMKLFNGSVFYNITLNDEINEKEVLDFLKSIDLLDYFKKFPNGLFTLLGDGGINISGGQKQILAMARALYIKPRILLLDEATSAMDQSTERVILQLLEKLKSNLAVLMVTHRLHLASNADRILMLDDGKVIPTDRDRLTSDAMFDKY